MADEIFEVRVSRILLLVLAAVGALFVLVGCDSIFHWFFSWEIGAAQPWYLWGLFYLFFFGAAALIFWRCVTYLPDPPLLLRVGPEGIAFGASMTYQPYLIPWRHYDSATYGVDLSDLAKLKADQGVGQLIPRAAICFKPDPEVPMAMATGAGLLFVCRVLVIFPAYANRLPWTIVAEVQRLAAIYTQRERHWQPAGPPPLPFGVAAPPARPGSPPPPPPPPPSTPAA